MVAVKMRGLPWRVETEEIEEFFKDYAWVRDSVRIGELEGGRRTGMAAVLFENEDVAAKAAEEMDREHVGSRWVQLYPMSYSQFESFMEDQLGAKTVSINNILNEENVNQYVKLRGIPRDASQNDVKEFFADFNVEDDDIIIEMRSGMKTGWALVKLNSEDDVQRARDELNKQYIGSRYIDVMIPRLEE